MSYQTFRNDLNDSNTNSASDIKGGATGGMPEISEYTDEAKQSGTKVPSPSKAPLNYIDNMGEWEAASKEWVKQVEEKQKELASVLGAYEVKGDELDKFRDAKTDLDIELEKVMGIIINKLSEHDDFLKLVYEKVYANDFGGTDDENSGEDVDGDGANAGNGDESENNGNLDVKSPDSEVENPVSELSGQIANILGMAGLNVAGIQVVPINMGGNGEMGGQEDGNNDENPAMGAINEFLHIVDPENWETYKGLLDDDEKLGVQNLYDSIKESVGKYWDLQYQIENLNARISQLENEENSINEAYNQGKKEVEDMVENMEDLNETYFLNSYLSTKSVSLDSFVSSDLVEKQIANIIELSKKGQAIPKTILLYGKSNLGKTYAANVLATELGRKMYHIKSYDIFTGGFSDPNAMLDAIFTGAIKKKEPCIIFLDEIEDFAVGDNGGTYQHLVENTIRHHISKIKESSLDIMIIGAISNRNRVGSSLLKQDVFSKQIYFTPLSKDKYEKLFHTMLDVNDVNVGDDIDIKSLLEKIKESDLDQEYLKKLIAMAIDFHQLNDSSDSDNIILSFEDFNKARDFMSQYSHNVSQGVGFNNN